MSVVRVCPKGHQWESTFEGDSVSDSATLVCPVCGEGEGLAIPPPVCVPPRPLPEIKGYEILQELGRGGMGVVYKARQTGLGRTVALKMIRDSALAGPEELARFRTEAEAIARLQHPHIVQIFEVGEQNGLPYFSLEFCSGGSLNDQLDGTPLPPRLAAKLVETLASAMDAAHKAGVVHRDLKPANVLLGSEAVSLRGGESAVDPQSGAGRSLPHHLASLKITDFGLAKKLDSEAGQTQSGAIMGSPSYMAPEQAEGKKEVGPAADIYALGAILYVLVTGRPPFRAATALDTMRQVISHEPVPPRRLQPKLPRDLDTICLKCLEKSPARRYATALDLADDLERWLNVQPIRARRIGPLGRAARWVRRNPAVSAVVAAAAILIVALTAFFFVRLLDENARTRDALGQAEIERDQATAAQERAKDSLAISLYEQARAVLLTRQPGRRGEALDLIEKAVKLRSRERLGPSEESASAERRPTVAELRRAATNALLLEDAQMVKQLFVPTALTVPQFSPDGRSMAVLRIDRGALKYGLCKYDLSNDSVHEEFDSLMLANLNFRIGPDGESLAVCGQSGAVEIFDLAGARKRQALARLKSPDGMPPQASFRRQYLEYSPDGRYLIGAFAGEKQTDLFLWDLREPARSRHLARVDALVPNVSFRADSRVLAYALGGTRIALADLEAGGEPEVVEMPLPLSLASDAMAPQFGIRLAWSPVEPLLAVLCVGPAGRGTILFWDIARRAERTRWEEYFGVRRFTMAFHPDGKRIAAGGDDIFCYHLIERREVLRLEGAHADPVSQLHWDRDGRLLSVSMLGDLRIWQPNEVEHQSTLAVGNEFIFDCAFSPDGDRLAVQFPGGRIALLDARTGREKSFFTHAAAALATMPFRPDGRQIALMAGGEAVVWDVATGAEERRHALAKPGEAVPFQPPPFLEDGRLLEVILREEHLVVRDVFTAKEIGPGIPYARAPGIFGPPQVIPLEWSPRGRYLVMLPTFDEVGNGRNPPVRFWEVATGTAVGEEPLPDGHILYPTGLAAFSPDEKWMVKISMPFDVEGKSRTGPLLLMFETATGRIRWRKPLATVTRPIAFSPDGKQLAVGYENGTVEVRATESGEELFRWQPKHGHPVRHIAFTADGSALATTDGFGPIQFLHVEDLRRKLAAMGLGW